MNKPPLILWIILVLLLVTVYIWSAVSPSTDDEIVIVQTTLSSFTPTLLHEKNPLLITDKVVNVKEFIQIAFEKWATQRPLVSRGQKIKSSFAIFHSPDQVITIVIKKPKTHQEVAVIVPVNNILILPMWWEWSTDQPQPLNVIHVNTMIGALCGILL